MEYPVRASLLRLRETVKMQCRLSLLLASIILVAKPALAQLPPLGENLPKPAASSSTPVPSGSMTVEAINTDLKAAATANQEKRYADAETLMLKVTASKPDLVLPWVQLSTAQIGLKKYNDAEFSLNNALGVNPGQQKSAGEGGFYQPDTKPGAVAPSATRASSLGGSGTTVITNQNRTPEVLGAALSNLGEVYIRTSR